MPATRQAKANHFAQGYARTYIVHRGEIAVPMCQVLHADHAEPSDIRDGREGRAETRERAMESPARCGSSVPGGDHGLTIDLQTNQSESKRIRLKADPPAGVKSPGQGRRESRPRSPREWHALTSRRPPAY